MMRIASAALLALVAGPAWAGDAWIAEYLIGNADGDGTLVLVRDELQVEYRMEGQAPRIWRKTPDGVEMQELHTDQKKLIAYSPGDLRTLGMTMEWEQLTGLVSPDLRRQPAIKEAARQFGQVVVRYEGVDRSGQPLMLNWLPEVGMPVLFRTGRPNESGVAAHPNLQLRKLSRLPSEQAFSSKDGLLEIDHADLGDMEMNPDMRRLTQDAHPGH